MATTRPLPVLRGERVLLRPVRDDDLAPLLAMLTEPDVACWFGSWNAARVQGDLLDPQDDEVVLAIEVDGAVGGVLMVGEEEEPDYRCVSIDLGLDAAHQGRGLGPEAMRLVIEYEQAPDGTWRDALLMDLLAEEYVAL